MRLRPHHLLLLSSLATGGCYEGLSPTSTSTSASAGSEGGDDHLPVQQCIDACKAQAGTQLAHCLGNGDQASCQAAHVTALLVCEAIDPEDCTPSLLEEYEDDGPGDGPSGEDEGVADESSGEPPPGGDNQGSDCDEGETWCQGLSLLYCDEGQSAAVSCDELCAAEGFGPAVDCDDDFDDAICLCEPLAECTHGESVCLDSDFGADCVDGQWTPPISCDGFCQDFGWDFSIGCQQQGDQGACDCRSACDPWVDTMTCSTDPAYMYWCTDGGWWEPENCEQRCAAYGALGTTGCQWHPNEAVFDCNCIW